ncbi:hypothetical protein RBWH47_02412 [Rhodopirellula baltica WH47]|uniref:Uncharacterized protein n=1 Tax=Rhodopirellula baltica WH47 TaxID=991778 RepID=F2AYB1_RHOBT|nr:hypothetical protein RBWH47_02412 [Rhodopirellula baltica WH47]
MLSADGQMLISRNLADSSEPERPSADRLDGATWFGAQRKRPSETTIPASHWIDLKR